MCEEGERGDERACDSMFIKTNINTYSLLRASVCAVYVLYLESVE